MAPNRWARTPLLVAAALLLASTAGARDDDSEFALKLADRGYEDLAQREIDRMIQGATPDKKEAAEYTRCQLLRRAALLAAGNAKSEPADVRTKFDSASKAFDAFLKAFANSRFKGEAEFNLANLKKDFAYYLTNNKDKFPAADQEGVVKEAGKIFDDAIKYLQSIKQREEERAQERLKSETEPDQAEVFADRNIAWYYLCMAMHDRAMLLPAGDALRTQQLTQAIDQSLLLLEETDGQIFGFLASRLLGQAYWHRAEMKKGFSAADIRLANEQFGVPVDAVDTYTNVEQDWPALVDVILDATVMYGEMCNAVGILEGVHYPKMFVAKVEELEDKIPGSMKGKRSGLVAMVQKSKALAAMGNFEASINALDKIINLSAKADASFAKAVEQEAKRGLNEVLATIPSDAPVTLAPDVLFKAGEGSLRDNNLGRALRTFQRVLVSIESEPDPTKRRALAEEHELACWKRINECYMKMERFLEAYLAADVPVQKYLAGGKKGDFEENGWLAYYRITALNAFLKVAPKDVQPKYVDLVKAAKEFLTREFNGHPSMSSTAYQVASSKLDQAGSADPQRAQELFQSAIDDFAKIDTKDDLYKMAQARIGQARVQMGKPQEGLAFLEALVTKNLADWSNPATPAGQKRPWGWAVFWMAMAQDDLKQPAKAVELLADYEKRFAGAGLETTYPRVRFTRIDGLVKAARTPEAEKECAGLMKDSPDNPYCSQASLVVANALKSAGDKAHKEGNKKAETDLMTRSAELYYFWVKRSSAAGAEEHKFVGSLFADIGDVTRAAELWEKALDIYTREKKAKDAETITIYLAGLLVGQGKYAEALPKFEELFIKTPNDVAVVRETFEWLKRRPSNVAQAQHDEAVKKQLALIADMLAKDPAGAAGAGEAKKAAATGETEPLVRAFADSPDMRRALARATALVMLGYDAAMPAERKNAVFALVKRTPDLMSNLARCYEELATAADGNPIRAINIYSTLIDAAPDPEGEAPQPGQKYSERWFGWKYRWINVYLATGTAYKQEVWLRIVCDLVKSMETTNQLQRSDKERPDFSKDFVTLRDKADNVLRSLGKEGCK
jgi:tetratricopeptide (TPR) repeat protein